MATDTLEAVETHIKAPAHEGLNGHMNGAVKIETRLVQARVMPARTIWVPVEVPEIILPPADLPYDDGEPLESNWHRAQISAFVESYQHHRSPARNFYAGGNMFVYFSSKQVMNRDFRGPDFFVVLDVDGEVDRKSWIVWEENGRYPDVIIELMSDSTANVDKTVKKALYAQTFKTRNYFYYDPDKQELTGFHLVDGAYVDLAANEKGQLWCEALRLWVGLWHGEYQGHVHDWIRFYDVNGNLVFTGEEAEAQRANDVTDELKRLRAKLQELGINPDKV